MSSSVTTTLPRVIFGFTASVGLGGTGYGLKVAIEDSPSWTAISTIALGVILFGASALGFKMAGRSVTERGSSDETHPLLGVTVEPSDQLKDAFEALKVNPDRYQQLDSEGRARLVSEIASGKMNELAELQQSSARLEQQISQLVKEKGTMEAKLREPMQSDELAGAQREIGRLKGQLETKEELSGAQRQQIADLTRQVSRLTEINQGLSMQLSQASFGAQSAVDPSFGTPGGRIGTSSFRSPDHQSTSLGSPGSLDSPLPRERDPSINGD